MSLKFCSFSLFLGFLDSCKFLYKCFPWKIGHRFPCISGVFVVFLYKCFPWKIGHRFPCISGVFVVFLYKWLRAQGSEAQGSRLRGSGLKAQGLRAQGSDGAWWCLMVQWLQSSGAPVLRGSRLKAQGSGAQGSRLRALGLKYGLLVLGEYDLLVRRVFP